VERLKYVCDQQGRCAGQRKDWVKIRVARTEEKADKRKSEKSKHSSPAADISATESGV
jgi:hypothetical protein